MDCIAYQVSSVCGISQEECWSELPFSSPGDLPEPGIEPTSPASPALAGRFFTNEPPGKPPSNLRVLSNHLEDAGPTSLSLHD